MLQGDHLSKIAPPDTIVHPYFAFHVTCSLRACLKSRWQNRFLVLWRTESSIAALSQTAFFQPVSLFSSFLQSILQRGATFRIFVHICGTWHKPLRGKGLNAFWAEFPKLCPYLWHPFALHCGTPSLDWKSPRTPVLSWRSVFTESKLKYDFGFGMDFALLWLKLGLLWTVKPSWLAICLKFLNLPFENSKKAHWEVNDLEVRQF